MTRTSVILIAALWLTACASDKAATNHDAHSDQAHADRMAKEHQHDTTAASHAIPEPAQPVTGERVEYGALADGTKLTGYVARPSGATGPLPAVIVVHEWWGLNENIEQMSRRIAGEGYLVLAVDLYEGKSAKTPDEAMGLMKATLPQADRLKENVKLGLTYLKGQQASKIASLGWCFGGAWSLQTATSFPEHIDAAVIYYGKVPTEAAAVQTLDAPLLGLFGGADDGIPQTMVDGFKQALAQAGKDAQIHVYEGAGHAFANPTGSRYQEAAATDAWAKTTEFLAKHLR